MERFLAVTWHKKLQNEELYCRERLDDSLNKLAESRTFGCSKRLLDGVNAMCVESEKAWKLKLQGLEAFRAKHGLSLCAAYAAWGKAVPLSEVLGELMKIDSDLVWWRDNIHNNHEGAPEECAYCRRTWMRHLKTRARACREVEWALGWCPPEWGGKAR